MTEGELLARQPDGQGGAEEAASSREALETALRLQRAADALISARTPEEVLDSVLTEGVRAAEARGGLIATLSDDGEWLDVVASRGYDEPLHRAVSSLPAGRKLSALRGGPHRRGSLPQLGARARRAVSRARRSLPAGPRARMPAARGGARPNGRARLLVFERPGVPARAPGAEARARPSGRARARTGAPGSGRAGAARAALPSSARRLRCSPRRSSSSGLSRVSPSSRCRCSPTGARSRCSSRRRGRSSRSSSPTRIPSESAGPRKCRRARARS